jgi:hypothetical protein
MLREKVSASEKDVYGTFGESTRIYYYIGFDSVRFDSTKEGFARPVP